MAVDTIITRFIQEGTSGLRGDLRAIRGDMEATESRVDRLSDRLLSLGAAGAAGLGALGYASVKAHGQIQLAEIGFSKTLGSMDAAKKKIQELRQFDRESPFSFTEAVKGAQRLSAVGFEANRLKDVLRDIGDAAAGTGGTTDDFMGISRAIGQMRSKGKISMEEINQLGDRGINALAILQKQLKLTDEQKTKLMQGEWTIDSAVGVEALLKGFRELYGGSMLEASKTFPGQISNLESAVFGLSDALGELLAKGGEAGSMLESLTEFTDKTAEFVRNNPELVKTGLYIAGVGVSTTLAASAGLKLYGVWRDVFGIAKNGIGVVKGLAGAVKADTAAEAAKAVVAGQEGLAIGNVGKAAKATTIAKNALAAATLKESAVAAQAAAKVAKLDKARIVASRELSRAMVALNKATPGSKAAADAAERVAKARAARAGIQGASSGAKSALEAALKAESEALAKLSVEASKATPKLSMLQRARLLLSKPLGQGASSTIPNLQQGTFRDPMGFYRTRGGNLAVRSQIMSSKTWNAAKLAAAEQGLYTNSGSGLRTVAAFGRGAAPVTVGGALMGAGIGVGAGMSAASNMKAAGYSDGQAYMYGAATGIGAAGAAMFLPGGPVAIAIAEAAAFGINKLFNEPLEKKAEEGSGVNEEETKRLVAAKTDEEKAQVYDDLAKRKRQEAITDKPWWQTLLSPASERHGRDWGGVNIDQEKVEDAKRAEMEANRLRAQSKRRTPGEVAESDFDSPYWQEVRRRSRERDIAEQAQYQTTHQRSGETLIRIPNRPADTAYRRRRNQSMKPVPRYA